MLLLKSNWERFANTVPIDIEMATSLLSPFIKDNIHTLTLLSNGCVNSNYKVTFHSEHPPVVLRLYVRNKDALAREVALQELIKQTLPVAKILYHDTSLNHCSYPYAIMEWIEGELMRDVILRKDNNAIAECAFAAGSLLSQLKAFRFNSRGTLNTDLSVSSLSEEEAYLTFTHLCLHDPVITDVLGVKLAAAVLEYITVHDHLLTMNNDAELTHGDFDATNMLVKKVNDHYEIAALLDWEFAMSDSYFLDMGIFLRYAHRLPDCYEREFINGLKTMTALPAYWKTLTYLMDILCLLSILYDNRHIQRPLMKQDIKSLLLHICGA